MKPSTGGRNYVPKTKRMPAERREEIRLAMLRARHALGMTLPEFACALGLTSGAVSSYECDKSPWPPYALARVGKLWPRVQAATAAWYELLPIASEAKEIAAEPAEFSKVS